MSTHQHDHSTRAEDPECPVCLMKVPAATSPSRTFEGTTYYFCSTACVGEFEENPRQFLDASVAA